MDMFDQIKRLRSSTLVKERNFGDVSSFNFTRKAFFDAKWNDLTGSDIIAQKRRLRRLLQVEEKCKNCRYCAELYTPPNKDRQPKYEYCCTLFLEENKVMSLESDIEHQCECFTPKKEVLN